jgi:hypothetical protein
VSRPPHPSWFNHPNNIRWRIQAVKFIIMQFSPRSVFIPFRSKCLSIDWIRHSVSWNSLKIESFRTWAQETSWNTNLISSSRLPLTWK